MPKIGQKASKGILSLYDLDDSDVAPVVKEEAPKGVLSQARASTNHKEVTLTASHLIVLARAGTGKTTTAVEGLKYMRGEPTTIIPSPQQQAIWDELLKSRDARFVAMVAFNRDIAAVLKKRLPSDIDSSTLHAMGFKAVRKAFPSLPREALNKFRVHNILESILKVDLRKYRKTESLVVNAVVELVSLSKMNLTKMTDGDLSDLAYHYEIELNHSSTKIFDLVIRVMDECKNVTNEIDYNDMVWLPVALNLPVFRHDLLIVDEAQDLNRCQQALTKMAGRRLVFIGDDKQAIYGFAGADSDSLIRLRRELDKDPVTAKPKWVEERNDGTVYDQSDEMVGGCITLPLTVTRRCGKMIVQEAQKYVPEFEAHESNCEGNILSSLYPTDHDGKERPYDKTYLPLVKDGDMVLCRVNAPLVSQCFRFLKEGRKATIQGRDILQGITSTINKQKASTVRTLMMRLEDWLLKETSKEASKKNPSEAKIIALNDRYSCIAVFAGDIDQDASPDIVIAKFEKIFTDDSNVSGIKLSSIHRAKGLEAKRVFFLQPKEGPCPHPMARSKWQRAQEQNLCYVAITRAIEELVYVY